jgi:N-acetylneuraminic acid mutarotase
MPSGRVGAMSWLDSTGQFWVFSGTGGANDMWSFNTSTLQWTWEAGTATVTLPSPGVYNTPIGTATATNLPGQRSSGATWVDSSGKFWMFGGYGYDVNSLSGYLNDLWSFNPATKWWTWEGGGSSAGALAATPDWGVLGQAAASNQPNPRSNSAYWKSGGNFYMFGGTGLIPVNGVQTTGVQNDLWQYNPTTNLWTWLGGTTNLNPVGIYGTKSTYVAGNIPGGRQGATTWTDSAGDIWLFGGLGIDSVNGNGYLNDLWVYHPGSNEWVWMNGSDTINSLGVYGTNAVGAATNQPGARTGSVGWIDASNNLWLFGGYGINYAGSTVVLNDLWEYVYATQEWVWVNGSYYGNTSGVYGTLGALSQYNMPGARYSASAWQDSAGYFWMFSGNGFDALGTNGRLNDVWRFFP